ncbi:hypothetical protein [Burkholderia glumae]|uniref:hypothetical protein n=1 Tax=Burkholderia glumae TaxID=337 RepID=UPI0020CBF5B2|nr:hypothetical protein [Burkholderia glumae]MCQ0031249.1 hypothetical protein [Burkholderia glumae]MCQ0038834.1 hypothetical protein [Burkholderia glumae]
MTTALSIDGAIQATEGMKMNKAGIKIDDPPAPSAKTENEASERVRVRQYLRDVYGVESMFVRVKVLSRILGISPATIRASMRAGRFALPHVVVCSAPLVRTDLLVDWMIAPGALAQEKDSQAADAHVDPPELGLPDRAAMRQLRRRLVKDTLEKMHATSSEGNEK